MHRVLIACALAGILSVPALAQQRQEVSFKIPGENTKYTVSQNLDVEDVPNHIVRLFAIHHMVPANAVSINGLKLVEVFARGTGDLIDAMGGGPAYLVFVAENGDKFFSRNNVVANRTGTTTWAGGITGGTGKFATIQGTTRVFMNFSAPPAVPTNSQFDIEYSIGK